MPDREAIRQFLKASLLRNPIVYIEHRVIDKKSIGKYYLLDREQLIHVTYDIAFALEIEYMLEPIVNNKTMCKEKCMAIRHPKALIRDLSEELYSKWNVIKFYEFKSERIF